MMLLVVLTLKKETSIPLAHEDDTHIVITIFIAKFNDIHDALIGRCGLSLTKKSWNL